MVVERHRGLYCSWAEANLSSGYPDTLLARPSPGWMAEDVKNYEPPRWPRSSRVRRAKRLWGEASSRTEANTTYDSHGVRLPMPSNGERRMVSRQMVRGVGESTTFICDMPGTKAGGDGRAQGYHETQRLQ